MFVWKTRFPEENGVTKFCHSLKFVVAVAVVVVIGLVVGWSCNRINNFFDKFLLFLLVSNVVQKGGCNTLTNLTTAWLAQLVERQSAVREVEGLSPRPDQHSGS